MARHVFRHAAQQETLDTFSPVGSQNDEIRTGLRRGIEDLPSDVTDLDCTVGLETRSTKLLNLSLYRLVTFLYSYLKLRGIPTCECRRKGHEAIMASGWTLRSNRNFEDSTPAVHKSVLVS